MASRSQKEQQELHENLRILATQVETINQQLAGGSGGGAGGPAMQTAMQSVEGKLNYLYDFTKAMQANISESQEEYFNQIGTKVTSTLNTNLTQLFAKLQELVKAMAGIQENLMNSPAIQAKDLIEMKKALGELISVYKDEVHVFREQNTFLQKRLVAIEEKLDQMHKSERQKAAPQTSPGPSNPRPAGR